MKKIIALAIAVVMIAALSVPCFAATAGTTTIEYTVGETYDLVVPSKVVLLKDGEAEGTVEVKDCALIEGHQVVVTAESEWKLNDVDETEFQFDETEFNFTEAGTKTFKVSFVNGAPTVPAVDPYTATVTFTGAIEVAPQ